MSVETTEDVAETAPAEAAEEANPMEGFAEAISAGMPAAEEESEPTQPEAVETSEVEETQPEPEEEETVEETTEPESKDEGVEPEAEQTVNFDGFSDEQKTTWERLHKDGHASAEEVERARLESLFQSNYTKKTMALADQRKEFAKEMEDIKDDLDLLSRIRTDDRLHDAWLKMSSGETESVDEDGDDLVDRKTAEKIADERMKARDAERDARSVKEQKVHDGQKEAIRTAMVETMELHSIDKDALISYIQAEEALLPSGTDPIAHFNPADLQYRVSMRHQIAVAQAKASAAEAKLSKRTSKADRTAKQSLPPARRVAASGDMTPLQQTNADLGLDPDWSNVTGFGNR